MKLKKFAFTVLVGFLMINSTRVSAITAPAVRLTGYGLTGGDKVYIALYDFAVQGWSGENPSKSDVLEALTRSPSAWVVLTPQDNSELKININHVWVYILAEGETETYNGGSKTIPLNLQTPTTEWSYSHSGIRVRIYWHLTEINGGSCYISRCFTPI